MFQKSFTTLAGITVQSKIITGIFLIVLLMAANTNAALNAPMLSSKTVTLSWTAPGDDGGSGQASYYDIRYSTTMLTESNWDQAIQVDGEPAPQTAGSAETFLVPGLNPSTTYYFGIKVGDEVPNWSTLSNIVTVTTSVESDAPATIADLVSTAQTQNSITLSWTAPGDDSTAGTATSYDIRYSTSPITELNWASATQISGEPTPSVAGSTESITIENLNESTTYYFAIKTSDEVPNESGLSNVLSASTTGDLTPPSAIDDLQANSGTNNGELTLSWHAPGDDADVGAASMYLIRYSINEINEANWLTPADEYSDFVVNPLTPSASGALEEYTIENLEPGQAYYVAIKAIDDYSNASSLSNVVNAVAKLDLSLDADDDQFTGLPEEFQLNQNYPNPFNPETEIPYALPTRADVNLSIYNSVGQKVATLVDGTMPAGLHYASWNGHNDQGQPVASGIYFYRLSSSEFNQTKKMVMLK